MTEVVSKITCDKCGYELQENQKVCPNCSSEEKTIHISVHEEVHIATCERMKIKDTQLPSNKKLRLDVLQGSVKSEITPNKHVKIKRIIDKNNNSYYEHVEDYNGTVLHHCEEPLSEHYGHGSAKNTSDNSRKPD